MVNFRHLHVFRTVARYGSVSAAARVLHVSQPAVTKTLHLVEHQLKLALFKRINGRLMITPEAEALIPYLDQLFGQAETIQQFIKALSDGHEGSMSVASTGNIMPTIVSSAVNCFRANHPRVVIELRAMSTREVMTAVSNNEADIGVIDVSETRTDFEMTELCRMDLVCVMRHDHRLASASHITAADLTGETIITYGEDRPTGRAIRNALGTHRGSGVVQYTVNQAQAAYALVHAGSGIALVDGFMMLTGAFPHLVMRPFKPVIQLSPRALLSKGRPISILAQKFLVALLEVADEYVDRYSVLMKPES